MDAIRNPYLMGFIALIVLYLLSYSFTKSGSPIAVALGHNEKVSTSLLQFWIFTIVTVFSYVVVFSARIMEAGVKDPFPSAPEIPINLLVLMGFSIVTATGSKGIAVSYLENNKITQDDGSNAIKNRDGDTDLTKVQMLIWTIITAVVYIVRVIRFVEAKEYAASALMLPDIDGSLLVLMGVSQGGYIGGKLVSTSSPIPIVGNILPERVTEGDEVTVLGLNFGKQEEDSILIIAEKEGEIEKGIKLKSESVVRWLDTMIVFTVPKEVVPAQAGTEKSKILLVRSDAKTSEGRELVLYNKEKAKEKGEAKPVDK